MRGLWSVQKSSTQGGRLGTCYLKWSEGNLQCAGNWIFPRTGVEKWSVKWREFEVGWRSAKCGEGKEIKVGGMWSVYKGSEVGWGVNLGTMCVIEYCIVWCTHCLVLVYLVVFNTDSSTLGSTHFCGLIVYNMCSCLLLVIFHVEGFLECYM